MKLVPEHINEVYNFERGDKDKMKSLGVGKKQLIESWLDEMSIEDYIINDDFTIDVKYYVIITKNIIKFPDYVQFNKAYSDFIIEGKDLITLKGFPYEVYGNFFCNANKLTSLEFCPKYVNGDFDCSYNLSNFTEDEVNKLCNVGGSVYV